MNITVFTSTYNRGYIIENLYHSLQRQTYKDFEWVVIDDGSSDGTDLLFDQILKDKNEFQIIYERTPNGGKHRAINRGVKKAKGRLFFIVDSDDYLTDNALERIIYWEKSIPVKEKNLFCGICGLKGKTVSEYLGTTFKGEFLDITSLERGPNRISGDKAEVFYTEILRKYPFPEFEGESFITECVVWDRIAYDHYKLRFFNEIIYICDYLPDGLTAHSKELFSSSPRGYGLFIYQSISFGKLNGLQKWNAYLKYYYAFRDHLSFWKIANYLHISPLKLWIRLLGLRIFNRLYK